MGVVTLSGGKKYYHDKLTEAQLKKLETSNPRLYEHITEVIKRNKAEQEVEPEVTEQTE
jgi:hypothetical protein